MVLSDERIRELWENYSPTKGIASFARSVEAEARRDALEEAAKVCEKGVDTEHPTVKEHIMKNFGQSQTLANAIRALKETIK